MPKDPFSSLPDSLLPRDQPEEQRPEPRLHSINPLPKPPPFMRRNYDKFFHLMDAALSKFSEPCSCVTSQCPHKALAALAGKTERLARNFRLEFYRARAVHRRIDLAAPAKYDSLTFGIEQTTRGWAVILEPFFDSAELVELDSLEFIDSNS